MKKFTFKSLAALFVAAPILFSATGKMIGQEVVQKSTQQQVQSQQQTQPQTQNQAQQQQTQQQAQAQTQNQAQQQQTQQQAQAQTQNQAQQQQTQQQAQAQTQNQAQQQQTQQQAQAQTQNQGQQQQTQQQAQAQTQNQNQKPAYVQVGRHWKIGTTWTVETVNIQKQGTLQKQSSPVAWVFTVIGETKVGNRDCFEVAIRCKENSDRQPHVSIWVDKASGMLMRVTTMTLVKGQWRTFTETYSVPEGKSAAVLGPIPSLPLDMPSFTDKAGSKGIDGTSHEEGMTYEVVTGSAGAKALGEVGFLYHIDQLIKPVTEEQTQELAGAKSLGTPLSLRDAIEVEIKNGTRNHVKQIWLPDTPWPVYSTNGVSESRLLEVSIPQSTEE